MSTNLNLIKNTFINHHQLKQKILIFHFAGFSVDDISEKLNIDYNYIFNSLISYSREIKLHHKEVK